MPAELLEHSGHRYAVQFCYALPFDAWCVELSEAVPAPTSWAEIPGARAFLPGPACLVAVVPDEDPDLEATVHIDRHDVRVIPYKVMRWFMDKVADEAERCRAAMAEGQPTGEP
jgi:hypothetical protein